MSSPLNEQDRADLVAYLDGELKGEAARTMENRIAREPALRAEANALRGVWELLEFLPLPESPAQFTHQTMEKLALVTGVSPPRRHWWEQLRSVGWAAAVGLALASGYGLTRMMTPSEADEQELVHDLRIIENKRLYESVEDLDFVRELDAPELFGDDPVGT